MFLVQKQKRFKEAQRSQRTTSMLYFSIAGAFPPHAERFKPSSRLAPKIPPIRVTIETPPATLVDLPACHMGCDLPHALRGSLPTRCAREDVAGQEKADAGCKRQLRANTLASNTENIGRVVIILP